MGVVFFNVFRHANAVLVCESDWSAYENRDTVDDNVVCLCPVQLLYVLNSILVCVYRKTFCVRFSVLVWVSGWFL
jgi:hypothetical protein